MRTRGKSTGVPAPETGAASLEEKIKDPAARFDSPAAVLIDPALTEKQKEEVLTSWVKDAKLLSEAENENMGGGEPSRLREATIALETLPHPPEGKKPK
jgi:hypothetical protein